MINPPTLRFVYRDIPIPYSTGHPFPDRTLRIGVYLLDGEMTDVSMGMGTGQGADWTEDQGLTRGEGLHLPPGALLGLLTACEDLLTEVLEEVRP